MDASEVSCSIAAESDLPGIAELFRRNSFGPPEVDWLRRKYLENPAGPARTFIAKDPNGNVVAARTHMPRLFTSARTGTFPAMQSVDLFVDKEHRGKGIHSKLREFLMSVRGDHPAFAFPNEIAKRITRTYAGDIRTYYPLYEWLYPVVVGQLIQEKPYRFLAPLADTLSKLYALLWLGTRSRGLQMKPVTKFDKDFEIDPDLMHGVRSADFLNWRFIDNPMRAYAVHQFIEDDDSIGYCVYSRAGASAEIFDLVLYRRWRECLRLLIDHCRNEGISHLSFRNLGFRLGGFGFIKRKSQSFFETRDTPEGDWLVTLADSDY